MSDFQLNSVTTPPPIGPVHQIETPKPPKAQSDHKPANPVTSSRGPSVVLSGALAKATERHGPPAQAQAQAHADAGGAGQRLNHVI